MDVPINDVLRRHRELLWVNDRINIIKQQPYDIGLICDIVDWYRFI